MGKAGSKPEDLRTSSDAERKNRYKHSPTSHKSLDVATMLALTNQKDLTVELKEKIAAAKRTKFIDLENCQLALFPGEILTSCPDLTQVQLSQNNLTELPPEMAIMTSLSLLRVASNKLKSIPQEVLWSATQLQVLDISRNMFVSFPKGIERLSDLARLVAHCNRITTIGVPLVTLTSLNTLDLSTNQLKTLPTELLELGSLKHLDINNNEIDSLSGIGRLSNLVQLLCAANKISTIPNELSKMYSLKEVDLSSNNLTSLPSCVSALDSLQKLNLNNNLFSQFPVEVTLVPRLIRLEIAENCLVHLRPEISRLNELAFLNLSGNQLVDVPAEIGQMTVLEMLDLTNNKLQSLPKEIGQLVYLSQLYIARNDLVALPTEINAMACLVDIDCLFNRLAALPASFGNTWHQIKRLSLANNRLRVLPPEIGTLSKLAELDLHCNKLATLPAEFTKLRGLEFLNVYRNKLKQLPDGFGLCLTNLQHLFLGYNQLTALPDEIVNMKKLKELFLSGNRLTSIGTLNQMQSLQDLFLAGNTLHSFPDLSQLTALRVLDVSANKLTTIPAYMSSLIGLRELNLTYNRCTSVPAEFTRLTGMRELYIGFNRLSDGVDRLTTSLRDCIISSYANKFVQSSLPPNFTADRKKFNKRLGIAEMLGRRITMEDTVTASLGVRFGRGKTLDFIGVFDGHGGRDASIYAAQNMQRTFLRHLEESGATDFRACLHATFMELSRQMSHFVCGTTAVALVLANGKIYTGNVGDSRAVLCRQGQALPITVDHTPRVPEEVQRLRALNGFVTGGRVNGILAVSRTLGDKYLHPFVNAEPFISELEIEPEDEFIILGCDGVWDTCTNQKAVDIVRKERHPIIASMKLRDHAYLSGSSDNISVVVVRLEPYRAGVLISNTPPPTSSVLTHSGSGSNVLGSSPGRSSPTGERTRRKNIS